MPLPLAAPLDPPAPPHVGVPSGNGVPTVLAAGAPDARTREGGFELPGVAAVDAAVALSIPVGGLDAPVPVGGLDAPVPVERVELLLEADAPLIPATVAAVADSFAGDSDRAAAEGFAGDSSGAAGAGACGVAGGPAGAGGDGLGGQAARGGGPAPWPLR